MSALLSPAELEAALRAIGAERYHDKHPFHRLLHGGWQPSLNQKSLSSGLTPGFAI